MLRRAFTSFFIPPGTLPDAGSLLWARGLRAFGDGFVSLLLPFYLTLLGFDALEIGVAEIGPAEDRSREAGAHHRAAAAAGRR